jgi:hypothetical protein
VLGAKGRLERKLRQHGKAALATGFSIHRQLRRPRNLRLVCSPGGDYIAVFEPDAPE